MFLEKIIITMKERKSIKDCRKSFCNSRLDKSKRWKRPKPKIQNMKITICSKSIECGLKCKWKNIKDWSIWKRPRISLILNKLSKESSKKSYKDNKNLQKKEEKSIFWTKEMSRDTFLEKRHDVMFHYFIIIGHLQMNDLKIIKP